MSYPGFLSTSSAASHSSAFFRALAAQGEGEAGGGNCAKHGLDSAKSFTDDSGGKGRVGGGLTFSSSFDIQVLFRPKKSPVEEKKKKGKARRSESRGRPGPCSSICFHGDSGLVFNPSTGEQSQSSGIIQVPIKSTSTSVYRRWRSDLRCIIPFFFLAFT